MMLRAAGPEDAAALAQVHALSFDDPWPTQAFLDLMASPGVFAVACAHGDNLAGLILMRAIAGEAEVLTLAVAPPHRRRGAAQALLAAGLAHAVQLGAETAFLEVATDNAAAIALYRGAGFEAVGRRPGYYRREGAPAIDALVLRRTLNSAGPRGYRETHP
jgi:ribosomal-protein-alanine N-acetyltransferase